MSKTIDIKKYTEFVDTLTSIASKDHSEYLARLDVLKKQGCDITRLDTAICGLMAESGEAMEILKKMKFQGKEFNEDIRYHLKREAGDIIFYWINLCIALGYDANEIIEENINKLKARYPNGTFDAYYSENRQQGDI